MSYIGSSSLQKLITEEKIITPEKPDRIKYGAYELSLGNEVFQTDSKSGKIDILKDEKEQIIIKPGQFALLLTEETLKIPEDKVAFISIKASIKLKGLINVSGFHVDPAFKGKLVFSVYNAGPATLILEKGSPYFPIWFAELNEKEVYKGEHNNQNGIPVKYIEALKAGEIASPNALSDRMDKLDSKQNFNDWLLKAIIGLVIAIGIRLLWIDFSSKTDFNNGYNARVKEITADSIVNSLLLEKKNILLNIDSIEKTRDSLNIEKEILKKEVDGLKKSKSKTKERLTQ